MKVYNLIYRIKKIQLNLLSETVKKRKKKISSLLKMGVIECFKILQIKTTIILISLILHFNYLKFHRLSVKMIQFKTFTVLR